MRRSAGISRCGKHRLWLRRRWEDGPVVCWIMLNPSTADGEKDDATIRKCIGFSERWGCGGLVVVNLFTRIATEPIDLAPGPFVNAERYLGALRCGVVAQRSVVVAWGGLMNQLPAPIRAIALERAATLRGWAKDWQCLGRTQAGDPRHPCRLPYATELEAWP